MKICLFIQASQHSQTYTLLSPQEFLKFWHFAYSHSEQEKIVAKLKIIKFWSKEISFPLFEEILTYEYKLELENALKI